jgi:hypothetical protein
MWLPGHDAPKLDPVKTLYHSTAGLCPLYRHHQRGITSRILIPAGRRMLSARISQPDVLRHQVMDSKVTCPDTAAPLTACIVATATALID